MSNELILVAQLARETGLTIEPGEYRGWRYRITIKSSSSSRLYTVSQNVKTLEWGCSCPGWKMARGGVRRCKHLTNMMPAIERIFGAAGKRMAAPVPAIAGPVANPAQPRCGRPRLSDAERIARQKARARFSFSDAAYRHYDAAREGFGSEAEWRAAVDRIVKRTEKARPNALLNLLGLDEMPINMAALRRAYRLAARQAHPDAGGSHEGFISVQAAFNKLAQKFS